MEAPKEDKVTVVVGRAIHEDVKIFAARSKGKYKIRDIFTDGAREWLNAHKPAKKTK